MLYLVAIATIPWGVVMFRLSKLQFSCTVLQYSFDKRLLKFYKLFAERLGLKVEKRDDTLFVVGDCLDLELSEHKGEYMISYNIWDEFPCNETIDYIKHMFLTKDVWADISINLFNPLPRYISGVDFSLGDYDTYWIFAIITRDCNLSCPYCYELKRKDYIETKRLIKFVEKTRKEIKKRRKKTLLDREKKIGVTIGGGEPTLHKDLPEFIKKIKNLEISVKLDTNGTNPEMVKDLIEKKLVDYIAMDIKAPPERYEEVCRCRVDMNLINETIRIIMNSSIDYEFRTTCPKSLISKEDIEKIGIWLKGARAYYIQQFRPGITLDPSFRNEKAYTEEELKELAEIAKPYFCKVGVRA